MLAVWEASSGVNPRAAPASRQDREISNGPPARPLRLIYVSGAVRSGSTALDVLLGSHPDVVSGGEIIRIAKYPEPPGYPCACGKGAWECPFWSPVLREFAAQDSLSELRKGWKRYEGLRALPRLWWDRRRGDPRVTAHVGRMHHLLQAIATASGRSCIVDSSKDPVRGVLYRELLSAGVDVRLLHLIRDGRGYLWSVSGRPDGSGLAGKGKRGRPVPVRIVQWVLANLASSLLLRRPRDRYLRLRYEDLLSDPAGSLGRLGGFLDLDLGSLVATAQAGGAFAIGHPIGGNRMRFSRTMRLRRDAEWESRLSRRDEWMFWALGGWLARAYGYTSSRGPGPARNGAESSGIGASTGR